MLSEIQVPPLVTFQPYFCPSNLSAWRLFSPPEFIVFCFCFFLVVLREPFSTQKIPAH